MIAKNLDTIPTEPAPNETRSDRQPTLGSTFPALLFVTGSGDDVAWIRRVLDDDAFSTHYLVEHVSNSTAALGQLHVQPFHAVIVRHTPPSADALDLLDALHLVGITQPVVVLAEEPSPPLVNRCYELGADAVLFLEGLTQDALLAVVARAIERFELRRETERLAGQERRRLVKDHREAEHLLEQQRHMIRELEAVAATSSNLLSDPAGPQDDLTTDCVHADPPRGEPTQHAVADEPYDHLPEELVAHYRELLRTYVIMGSGSLIGEIGPLSRLFVAAGTRPEAVMGLHLESIEHLVRGLGQRSRRHVMSRAHLLALEVMVHLARRYQQAGSERLSQQHKSQS